jgi:hypothetical protein
MPNAYIVDSTYIKTNYPVYIDNNVDDNLLNSAILIAQNVLLQELIGYTMYNFIISGLISDPTGAGFSTQYLYIIENYIQPAVALMSLYNAFPTIWVRITNKSIVTKKGDDSESVNLATFNMIRNEIKNNYQFFSTRVIEYITNYPGDFNEYYITNGVNRIFPKMSAYANGIYLKSNQVSRGRIEDQRGSGAGYPLNW